MKSQVTCRNILKNVVTEVGFEPTVFTSWVADFKSAASQPVAPLGHGNIILELMVGFEPTVVQFCRLLLWATQPHEHKKSPSVRKGFKLNILC